jgi:transposase-like protein
LQAWAIYQRLVLRLPYHVITQALEEQFHVRVNQGTIVTFIRNFARDYAQTEERCREQLLRSPFIHADETKINIQGTNYYTWVFTDGRHVLFRLSATRESVVVREVLGEYTGILITEFYGGYDAVPCRQQKCLVHLIRDLNNDLWRRPFDTELETFVAFVMDVRDLLVPILEAANKYGLRKRNLCKFTKAVASFYRRAITSRVYRSEPVRTYQKRFRRYRQSLFTFLEYDGIPWNNNMGERALRHLTVQRKISGSFYESLAPAYLLLLGLAQTCRFQDKSLLKFLLSGEKDVDAFRATKRHRGATAPGPHTNKSADDLERAISVATAASQAESVVVGGESLSMSPRRKYPEQLLVRGVRLVFESGRPVAQVARDLGVHPEALRLCVRRAQARGDVLNGAQRQRLVELERENAELRRANEILRAASR